MKTARIAALAAFVFALAAAPALAHRIDLFASVSKGMVVVEAAFPGGQPARGVEITAAGPSGTPFVTGKTGNDGKFSFPVPAAREPLTIVANDHMGHRATFTLKAEDLGG